MALKPPIDPTSSVASAGLGTSPRIINAGNLGSSYSLDVDRDVWVWLVGTLNANCTITFSDEVEGSSVLLLLTQDGTGGRTVTVSDGSTSTNINQISTVAGAFSPVRIDCTSTSGYKAYSLQGQQGVAGDAMGVLGVDVWASQSTPESITDWGPTINGLTAAGAKLLLFRDEDFPITTAIDLKGSKGYAVQFMGEGGRDGALGSGSSLMPQSRLIWKGGASTGPAFQCDGSNGLVFQHLSIMYDNAAFDGDLMRFSNSVDAGAKAAGPVIKDCFVGNNGNLRSARVLLCLVDAVGATIERNRIRGAQWLIRGHESFGSGHNPDDISILRNRMSSASSGMIGNVGTYWEIVGNHALYGDFSVPVNESEAFIDSDLTCTSYFHAANNRHWDEASGITTHPYWQRSTNTWIATISDHFYTFDDVYIQLDGPGSIAIEDCHFNRSASSGGVALIDAGTEVKDYLRIKGNSWTASSDPANVIANLNAGHRVLDVGPNREDGGFPTKGPRVWTVGGHERAHWVGRYLPTIAKEAGQPTLTFGGNMQDGFGYVRISTPAGTASNAGHLATITFPNALEVGFGANKPDSTHQVPYVWLSPYGISNDSFDLSETIACGLGVKVTGGQQTAFEIHTKNAIPANKQISFVYRVLQP